MSIKVKYNQEIDGILSIKDEYTFPETDGTNGQVLKTDGLGSLTWQDDTSVGVTTLSALTDVVGVDYTAGTILVGDGVDSFDQVAMSGDVTIDSAGATTIGAGVVEKSMIENVSNLTVLGNTSGAPTSPQEVIIDTDISTVPGDNSQLASSDAIKNYIDSTNIRHYTYTIGTADADVIYSGDIGADINAILSSQPPLLGIDIFIQAGQYNLTTPIAFKDRTYINIRGAGHTLTSINAALNGPIIDGSNSIDSGGGVPAWYNSGIFDIRINNTSKSNVGGVGIYLFWSREVTLQNVVVENCETGIIQEGGCFYNILENVTVADCVLGAKYIEGTYLVTTDKPNATKWIGGKIITCDSAIDIIDGNDNSLDNVQIENFSTRGIYIDDNSNTVTETCRLETTSSATFVELDTNSSQCHIDGYFSGAGWVDRSTSILNNGDGNVIKIHSYKDQYHFEERNLNTANDFWHLKRSGSGDASSLLFLQDTYPNSGSPNTLHVQGRRPTGNLLLLERDNGSTIDEQFSVSSLGVVTVSNSYSFPTSDGTNGQVLTTDGLGSVTFETNYSGAFSSNGTTITESAAEYDVDFVVGSPQLDDDTNLTHDARMFFDKGKSAFRAGRVTGTQWDNANLGLDSHAEGINNTASGGGSHAEGSNTTASASYSHSEGSATTASGVNSHAEGQNSIASGQGSHAEGNYSEAYLHYQHANSSGRFTSNGDSQNSTIELMRETTNNTTTELTIANLSPAATSRLILPASRTWGFKILVSARQTGGTSGTVGDSHIFKVEGGIKRDGSNNTAMIGTATVSTIVNDAGASAWTVAVSADDTNESLKIDVTGETDKTIHWTAKVELVEVG